MRPFFSSGLLTPLLLTALCLTLFGCPSLSRRTTPVPVEAQYRDLEGKTVAVLVAAADQISDPQALPDTARIISKLLGTNVKDVTVIPWEKSIDYQNTHPYWLISPPSEVIRALGVDRLVQIELSEFRLTEPGNRHVWRASIAGNLGVLEASSPNPNDFVFRTKVMAFFPNPNTNSMGIPVTSIDEITIRVRALHAFGLKAAGLFYDHEEIR